MWQFWTIIIITLIISTILVICFYSTSVVRGSFTNYNVTLEKGTSIYFNAKNGVSRIGVNGIELKNPYKIAFNKSSEGDFHLLLLNRPEPIKSSSVHFYGPYSLRITGYQNGGISVKLIDTPNNYENIEFNVYGEEVFDRSDSIYRFLPVSINNHMFSKEDLRGLVDKKVPFVTKIYNFGSHHLGISSTYDSLRLVN